MKRNHVATAEQMRAHDTAMATRFTEVSALHARAGDAPTAVACQWVGDVHRVSAALWARAAGAADPHARYFELAEKVLTAAGPTGAGAGVAAAQLVSRARAALSASCAALDVPLVFPAATHLEHLPAADLTTLSARTLGGATAQDVVADRLLRAGAASGSEALRLALEAYLVDVAAATGDAHMVTAAARIAALGAAGAEDRAALEVTARELLGPVEWIRFSPYLARCAHV